MLRQSHDSFSCLAEKRARLTNDFITEPNCIIPFLKKSPDLNVGGGGARLIPDSMFLVFNTVRMYQRCSEAQACCQTHLSVSYLGGKETWREVKFLVTV